MRSLGPALVPGRIADVAIDPKNPNVWYVATAFGGLWKTVNRGVTFTPIFDDGPSFTLCCVVVDPKDSNVIWLGTGENASQRSAHFGDGVYKSLDAGKTWKRVGLESSEHLGKIVIDPRNSNTVFVASQGPLFSSGGDRGVFKTTDGGATWKAVLTISADTGVSDLVIDPNKPDVMYASAYQRRRHVGQMIGGGPEGGIYKTTNGGTTWAKLAGGLPKGDIMLQAGSFKQQAEAEKLIATLALNGIEAKIQRFPMEDETWYRVRIGPIATAQEFDQIRTKLQDADIAVTPVAPMIGTTTP